MLEDPGKNRNESAKLPQLVCYWNKMLAGDKVSFEKIYHHSFQKLYRYGCKVADEDTVEEVIQELFINLWQKKEDLPKVSAPLAYLFRSFHNRLLNQLSKNKKEHFLPLERADYFSYQLIDEVQNSKRKEVLQQAINNLSNQQREVIYLLYFNGLSASEVAEVLSLKKRTVYNTAYQAVSMLRKHLQKDLLVYYLLPVSLMITDVL